MYNPEDSVRIVIFDEENTAYFPIVREADETKMKPNNWKLVGGHLKETETPIQAAVRETEEEAGRILPVFDAGTRVNDDGHSVRYLFAAMTDRKWLEPTAEIAELRWVTEDEVPDCNNKEHILTAVAAARVALNVSGVRAQLILAA